MSEELHTAEDMRRAWREGWDRAMSSVFVAKLPNRSPDKDNPYGRRAAKPEADQ
jgi:hypothetical protein